MKPQRLRTIAAALLGAVGLIDIVVAAVPHHGLRIGWDAVPAYGWPRYALTAAGVMCLAVAPAVARGRREALWLGVVVAGVSAVVALVHDADILALGPSLAALGALTVTARRFPGRSDPRLARRALRLLVIGEGLVLVYATIGLYLLDANFRAATTLGESFREGFRMLFLLPPAAIQPVTAHGAWFLDSVRWLSVLVVAVACARALAPTVGLERRRRDRERAERILEKWATSSLAPFQLLEDKHWCFSDDGDAFVGYALVGSTAVALGGPIGAPASRPMALSAFLEMCAEHAWMPVFHQVDANEHEALRGHDFQALKIGEEAVVPLADFTLAGRSMKSIRNIVNRANRDGLTVEELPRPLDDAAMAELRSVSDDWLGSSGHRERGFTLGDFDPDTLRESPVLAARDADGLLVAFVTVVPSYAGTIGNFDLMRRRSDAPRGTMELLFVALIERFRGEGLEGMSLGLAPLAGVEGNAAADRVIALARGYTSLFNFAGLQEFKAKWQPRWEPRYFAYPTTVGLPRAAAATALAGERPSSGTRLDALARIATRFPLSIALVGTLVWFMLVTEDDPGFHASLVNALGLDWQSLTAGELWRIPGSALIQEDSGIAWTIVALLAAIPLAEARFGWRVTLAGFFLADAVSVMLVLVILRLAGAAGIPGANALTTSLDAGSSAGLLALLAGWIAVLDRPRLQLGLGGALAAGLVLGLALERDLADVQHVVAAALGAAGAVALTRSRRSADGAGRPGLSPKLHRLFTSFSARCRD